MPPTPFDVALEIAPHEVTLTLSGELDLFTLPRLQQALAAAEAGDAPRVVVDLRNLSFIDSAGVVALIRATERAAQRGRSVETRRGPGLVERTVGMMGVRDLLPVAA